VAWNRERWREAWRESQRRRYADPARREQVKADRRASHARRVAVKRAWVDSLDLACPCGESDRRCLDFHHRDPATKAAAVSYMIHGRVSLERLQREVAKCDVLCANCHRKAHARRKVAGAGFAPAISGL
jgi:hypothetical protein